MRVEDLEVACLEVTSGTRLAKERAETRVTGCCFWGPGGHMSELSWSDVREILWLCGSASISHF